MAADDENESIADDESEPLEPFESLAARRRELVEDGHVIRDLLSISQSPYAQRDHTEYVTVIATITLIVMYNLHGPRLKETIPSPMLYHQRWHATLNTLPTLQR